MHGQQNIKITVYVSGCTETNMAGMLSPSKRATVWRPQSGFVSSRQSGQTPAAVCIGSECCCNGQNVPNRTLGDMTPLLDQRDEKLP